MTVNRRDFIINSSVLICPVTACYSSKAEALVWGFFGTSLISNLARSAAQLFMKRTIRNGIVSSSVSEITKNRTKKAIKKMAWAPRGESAFTEIVTGAAGGVIGDVASGFLKNGHFGNRDANIEISIVHAETPDKLARCVAFTSNVNSEKHTNMWETPEILAGGYTADFLRNDGLNEKNICNVVYPIELIDNGYFTYDKGHSKPSIHKTSEGRILVFSKVLSRKEGRVGIEFQPDKFSSFKGFTNVFTVS